MKSLNDTRIHEQRRYVVSLLAEEMAGYCEQCKFGSSETVGIAEG